jgi:hypothetical protein
MTKFKTALLAMKNPVVLTKAQDRLEREIKAFEDKKFVFSHPTGFKLVLKGNKIVDSLEDGHLSTAIDPIIMVGFIQDCQKTIEVNFNKMLASVRNEFIKKHKLDLKLVIPEVAKAIESLERQSTATASV